MEIRFADDEVIEIEEVEELFKRQELKKKLKKIDVEDDDKGFLIMRFGDFLDYSTEIIDYLLKWSRESGSEISKNVMCDIFSFKGDDGFKEKEDIYEKSIDLKKIDKECIKEYIKKSARENTKESTKESTKENTKEKELEKLEKLEIFKEGNKYKEAVDSKKRKIIKEELLNIYWNLFVEIMEDIKYGKSVYKIFDNCLEDEIEQFGRLREKTSDSGVYKADGRFSKTSELYRYWTVKYEEIIENCIINWNDLMNLDVMVYVEFKEVNYMKNDRSKENEKGLIERGNGGIRITLCDMRYGMGEE